MKLLSLNPSNKVRMCMSQLLLRFVTIRRGIWMEHLTFSMYLCLVWFYFCGFLAITIFVGIGFPHYCSTNENLLQKVLKRVGTFGYSLTFQYSLRILGMCFSWSFAFFASMYKFSLNHLVCFEGIITLQHVIMVVEKNYMYIGYGCCLFLCNILCFYFFSLMSNYKEVLIFLLFLIWCRVSYSLFSITSGNYVQQFQRGWGAFHYLA